MLDVKCFTKTAFPRHFHHRKSADSGGGEEEGKDLLTLEQG